MTILLTGATGFIGSHVAMELGRGKNTIIAPVRNQEKAQQNPRLSTVEGIIFREGEFYQPEFLAQIFREFSIDYVIHLAAIRGNGKGKFLDYQRVNVTGTENLLEFAWRFKVKRFIHFSTVGVWGTIPATVPPDANTPHCGDNLYHQSKIEAEAKVTAYRQKGVDAIIIRPTITYGEGDNGFAAKLVKLVRQRRLILPNKEVKIHLVSVRKVAELTARMLSASNIINYIVLAIDKKSVSLSKIVNIIHIHFYKKPYPAFLKFPEFVFWLSQKLCKTLHFNTLSTQICLISRDWYFTPNDLMDEAIDTEYEFITNLKNLTC